MRAYWLILLLFVLGCGYSKPKTTHVFEFKSYESSIDMFDGKQNIVTSDSGFFAIGKDMSFVIFNNYNQKTSVTYFVRMYIGQESSGKFSLREATSYDECVLLINKTEQDGIYQIIVISSDTLSPKFEFICQKTQ